MPSLTDRITRFFSRSQGTTVKTTAAESSQVTDMAHISNMGLRFQAETTRRGKVALSRKIYGEDPRMEGIINTLARDVANGEFQIETDDTHAADIAADVIKRLKVRDKLDDWVRVTLRDGDNFYEVAVSGDREIVDVSRWPTLHMNRNTDAKDKFPDPVHAFWMSDYVGQMDPHGQTLWFAQWQIIHARWAHDDGDRYGSPLMSSGQKVWKRIDQGELNVAVRRATRSGRRYHHIVDGDEADILKYRKRNEQALSRPDLAQADFFSNGGSITVLSGDELVGQIDDIIHHIETWWTGAPVPRGILGYGRDLNRDVLREQKEQYDETLPAVQRWAASQFIKPLIELEWLLNGIVPEQVDYEITWSKKKLVTPEDVLKIVQAAQLMRGLGIPEDVIQIVVSRFLPGIEPDMLEMDTVGNDAARLDAIAQMINRAQNSGNQNGQNEPDPQTEAE